MAGAASSSEPKPRPIAVSTEETTSRGQRSSSAWYVPSRPPNRPQATSALPTSPELTSIPAPPPSNSPNSPRMGEPSSSPRVQPSPPPKSTGNRSDQGRS